MTIRNKINRFIQKRLNGLGYTVTRISDNHLTMESAMSAILRRGHTVNSVIDVGASNGSWSAMMMERYPAAQYLLIEAQKVHEQKLHEFCAIHPNAAFSIVAAGERSGVVHFDASDPFSGQASLRPDEDHNVVVPMDSIDHLVQEHKMSGPFLLKLDTHGFEVQILGGAERTLRETEIIIMECYNFKIAEECLLFYQMCGFLEKLGFRCIDLVNPLHRPLDYVLWQMDLVFARQTRPEFGVARYR